MHILDTPIDFLKGVGPFRSDLLKKELRIFNYGDLLMHYPFRYIDRSKIHTISELRESMPNIQLKGKIIKFEEKGQKRAKRLIAHFQDETGIVELVWFKGARWIRSSIKLHTEYIVFGKPSAFKGNFNIVHPEMDMQEENQQFTAGLQAVYHTTELLNAKGLSSRAIGKLTKALLPLLKNQLEETLSASLVDKLNLPTRFHAFVDVHQPKDAKSLVRAQKRLKFEEFFFLQLYLLKLKLTRNKKFKGYPFENLGESFNEFYNKHLPFELTGAQKRVLKEIRNDVRNPQQMNRLLQGDVGSGKTLVALLSMLMAVDNGYQACLMAPTEILTRQHFTTISEYLKEQNIKVAILTGSTKTKERRILHEQLENGEINILIGTHALIEDKVKFKNLAFVVIDEQHRFGVAQRAKLWKKNKFPPHMLVMTVLLIFSFIKPSSIIGANSGVAKEITFDVEHSDFILLS